MYGHTAAQMFTHKPNQWGTSINDDMPLSKQHGAINVQDYYSTGYYSVSIWYNGGNATGDVTNGILWLIKIIKHQVYIESENGEFCVLPPKNILLKFYQIHSLGNTRLLCWKRYGDWIF